MINLRGNRIKTPFAIYSTPGNLQIIFKGTEKALFIG
uniref:Uncharacterized protein n=1 Tax=Anguilla anguilla TaxID=7936 RepID=A0A0E9SMC9_ANGAN